MIFYLSCTGNTLWAAQQLAAATGETLISIPEALHSDCRFTLAEDERIGFCFPVHGWRPPAIVRSFIGRMQIVPATGKHYVYALCTAGDDIGTTMGLLEKDLQPHGLTPDAEWTLIMPESYVGLPFMDVDPPAKEKRKKEEAARQLKTFCTIVAQRQRGRHLVPGALPRLKSGLLGAFFLRFLIKDKKFRVESRRCVKCGICADVCPTGDIVGGLGKEPVWQHNGSCLTCFACYHHCPHHAIEFGRQTKHKGQYFFK